MVWLALGVVVGLLIFAWEREDKQKAECEHGEFFMLPSGQLVEIWDWPQAEAEDYREYVARRAVRQ